MARRIPENRFDELIATATEVFIARGYRLTQMSDVADALGVAKGTLYGYVESKDALFVACVLRADPDTPSVQPEALPVPGLKPGQLAALIKERTAAQSIGPSLSRALGLDRADAPGDEFESIVREFYDTLERYCRVIKLIDRCTDHSELQIAWQTEARIASRLALERYLASRIAAGQLRHVANVALAARLIIEVCTTWAIHIKWDQHPQAFDPLETRENAVDFLVQGFVI